MKHLILTFMMIPFICCKALAQDVPEVDWDELNKTKPWEITEVYRDVPLVTPATGSKAPSDAIVLFDGTDLSAWQKPPFGGGVSMKQMDPVIRGIGSLDSGEPAAWIVENGELVVKPGAGAIATKRSFGDVQLHLEWLAPKAEGKAGQGYSNCGVFLMGLYEVQVLNSYENPTYSNGQAGAVYKQHVPLVNASRPPGEWQRYDIIFTAPRFSAKGTLIRPARVTVLHNGVLIQNNVVIQGPTVFIGEPYYVPHADKLPLVLQDHGDPVRFRNIWIREL